MTPSDQRVGDDVVDRDQHHVLPLLQAHQAVRRMRGPVARSKGRAASSAISRRAPRRAVPPAAPAGRSRGSSISRSAAISCRGRPSTVTNVRAESLVPPDDLVQTHGRASHRSRSPSRRTPTGML